MGRDFYELLAHAAEGHQTSWLTTVVTTSGSTPARLGMKMIVFADGSIRGTIGGGELEKMVIEKIAAERPAAGAKWAFNLGSHVEAEYRTAMICGGVEEILVEPLHAGPPLVIVGGGHCGAALSWLASWVGFDVTVYDNRPEWTTAEKHPAAGRRICGPYEAILPSLPVSPDAFVVIMTHGHQHDGIVLRQMLGLPLRYLGMIGSAKKVDELFRALRSEGIPQEQLDRVHAPIGVRIGSHTPEEIAVSIVAEMIAERNRT